MQVDVGENVCRMVVTGRISYGKHIKHRCAKLSDSCDVCLMEKPL